jgi:hypothetical protein
MPHSYDGNNELVVVDGVQNTILPLSNSKLVVTRKFLTSGRTRVCRETSDSADDPESVFLGDGLDFLGR